MANFSDCFLYLRLNKRIKMLSYIIWNVRPEIFSSLPVRWYGLLFALGFLVGQYIVGWMFKVENKPQKDLEKLMIYMVVATILGARLGHCLFYQPDYYLSNPIEILKIWEGGLASHGAAVGILLALYLYSRKRKGQSFLWVVDRVVVVVALAGAFIRMGNLINSEIIGKPYDGTTAFVFTYSLDEALKSYDGLYFDYAEKKRAGTPDTTVADITYIPLNITLHFDKKIDETGVRNFMNNNWSRSLQAGEVSKHYKYFGKMPPPYTFENGREGISVKTDVYGIPRHPSQLYESIFSFFVFVLLLGIYFKYRARTPEGLLFGLFMILIFTSRFLIEFLKENQVSWEDGRAFNQGQLLSIPAILIGLVALFFAYKNRNKQPQEEE